MTKLKFSLIFSILIISITILHADTFYDDSLTIGDVFLNTTDSNLGVVTITGTCYYYFYGTDSMKLNIAKSFLAMVLYAKANDKMIFIVGNLNGSSKYITSLKIDK